MPSSYAPIVLTSAVGPGFANDPEDLARLGAGIEARTGVSPFARLADDGSDTGGLPPGYAGAIKAAQIVKGTDPDGVVLPDGATLQALNEGGSGFAPLPKIKATIGSRGPNRPADLATGQAKLARVGYAPRVADPAAPGHRRVDQTATTKGIHAFQRANGLAADGFMNPNGPTERTLDAQIGRQQKALEAALDETTQENLRRARAGDSAVKGLTDLASARAAASREVSRNFEEMRIADLSKIRNTTITKRIRPRAFADTVQHPSRYATPASRLSNEDDALIAYWEAVAGARGYANVRRFARKKLQEHSSTPKARGKNTEDVRLEPAANMRNVSRRTSFLPPVRTEINNRSWHIIAETYLRRIRRINPKYRYQSVRAPRPPGEPFYTEVDARFLEREFVNLAIRREMEMSKMSGIAWSSRPSLDFNDRLVNWLHGWHHNASFIPAEIVDELFGRTFANFSAFKRELWKRVAARQKYSRYFSEYDLSEMKRGKAPFAPESQRLAGRDRYEIHHIKPLYRGGALYDMSNMIIVTPLMHLDIIPRNLHFGR